MKRKLPSVTHTDSFRSSKRYVLPQFVLRRRSEHSTRLAFGRSSLDSLLSVGTNTTLAAGRENGNVHNKLEDFVLLGKMLANASSKSRSTAERNQSAAAFYCAAPHARLRNRRRPDRLPEIGLPRSSTASRKRGAEFFMLRTAKKSGGPYVTLRFGPPTRNDTNTNKTVGNSSRMQIFRQLLEASKVRADSGALQAIYKRNRCVKSLQVRSQKKGLSFKLDLRRLKPHVHSELSAQTKQRKNQAKAGVKKRGGQISKGESRKKEDHTPMFSIHVKVAKKS